jgi:LPS-assembly protein
LQFQIQFPFQGRLANYIRDERADVERVAVVHGPVARDALKQLVAARVRGGAVRLSLMRRTLRNIYIFITITLIPVLHPQVWSQEVSKQAPPAASLPAAPVSSLPAAPVSFDASQVSSSAQQYPVAEVLPGPDDSTAVVIESSGPQSKVGSKFILDGDVVITYGDRKVQADHIEYDTETGEIEATGHLKATGGLNSEIITASHGSLNVKTQTGRFYDVAGSVGLKPAGKGAKGAVVQGGRPLTYANENPFLFTGQMVVKTGPQEYEIFKGTVTSCRLAHPDWVLYANKFTVDEEKARATGSVFKLLNVPLLYLPYVTHPVDVSGRQSGVLLPVVGESSTKGLVLGEQIYWAINRSADLTFGSQYFSRRGWEQAASFRFRGLGDDFVRVHYSGLIDRGYVTGGVYVNQGGQDLVFSGRKNFGEETRLAADVEYLSSYPYREAFTENFNQAVSTDILSVAYGVHEWNGYEVSARADRYQGLKRVPTATLAGEQVKIYHVPSIDFSMSEHALGTTGLRWSVESSAAGLKRVEPFFVTSGIIERLDLHPQVSYPLSGGGWHFRPTVGVRETFYSRSRVPSVTPGFPVESSSPVNRSDVEAELDVRPPVLEQTFTSGWVRNVLRRDVRHTIEPDLTYRYVAGVNNFTQMLRFDAADVVSGTNELEYGVTQRLFLRPGQGGPCKTPSAEALAAAERVKDDGDVAPVVRCGAREWISWRVAQKYFFDKTFGGAVQTGRRNILDTTLNFSGISFLTEPREVSPLISRFRMRASEKLDVEWDFDVDTGAKKFTSNNVLLDLHEGSFFGGISYARLNAPGRSYTEGIPSATSDFSQLRVLMGYGSPTKKGLGMAANAGLDLNQGTIQYGALEASYNWDCCGLSIEYRKYELGSVRNENAYRFNFTLVNIGTAGNLRRAERLF